MGKQRLDYALGDAGNNSIPGASPMTPSSARTTTKPTGRSRTRAVPDYADESIDDVSADESPGDVVREELYRLSHRRRVRGTPL